MFELTINGQTKQFKTAKEMNEWKQRMQSPLKIKPPRQPKVKATKGLYRFIK